ncbi:hypothetical protein BH09ACT9_BH09ACT9_24840 [soil metagenome]
MRRVNGPIEGPTATWPLEYPARVARLSTAGTTCSDIVSAIRFVCEINFDTYTVRGLNGCSVSAAHMSRWGESSWSRISFVDRRARSTDRQVEQ